MPSRKSPRARDPLPPAKPDRANPRLPQPVLTAARVLLTAYIILIAVPIRYHPKASGFDQSWAFALNYFAAKGVLHGKDVFFPYGPLSYLTLPMDVGTNLAQGLIVQLAFWLLYAGTIAWIAWHRRVALWRLVLYAALLYVGVHSFHDFGYAGPDVFLGFWVLLLLGCSLEGDRRYGFYAAAVVSTALLLLVKFSSGISALSAVVVFPLGMAFSDRRSALRAAVMGWAGTPLLFAVFYLIYCPSLGALARYVRAGFEISSGYSIAMSQEGASGDLMSACFIGLGFILLTGLLAYLKAPALALALACLGPLFLEYKHAFVRYAGHIEIFFKFAPLALGVLLLFVAFSKRAWWGSGLALGLFALGWLPREGRFYFPSSVAATLGSLEYARPLADFFSFTRLRQTLEAKSNSALEADRLPPELVAHLAHRSVAIVPWEVSYAAANPIEYRPFPLVQTIQAYTALLDGWDAGFFRDPARAPEFVLMEWDSIDDRHPFLDVPGMFLALYRNYDLDSAYGTRILLRRRSSPRFHELRPLGTRTMRPGQPLQFEERAHPLVASIHMNLTPAGRVRKFLYRIPEVRAILSSDRGRFISARVTPDVMANGMGLNFTPVDLESTRRLFGRDEAADAMNALVLTGPGAASYDPAIKVDLYEIPEVGLSVLPETLPDLSVSRDQGVLESAKIETLNGLGVLLVGPNEVLQLHAPLHYLLVQGWAVDSPRRETAGRVYVELDGKLYPAHYGLPRLDVAMLLKDRTFLPSGFDWTVPSWKLGDSPHELTLKVLTRDGAGFYAVSQRIRFRLVN